MACRICRPGSPELPWSSAVDGMTMPGTEGLGARSCRDTARRCRACASNQPGEIAIRSLSAPASGHSSGQRHGGGDPIGPEPPPRRVRRLGLRGGPGRPRGRTAGPVPVPGTRPEGPGTGQDLGEPGANPEASVPGSDLPEAPSIDQRQIMWDAWHRHAEALGLR